MATLKDSGNRRMFDTGANRDVSEGKGRCDLLPLDIARNLTKAPELSYIERFKSTKDTTHLYEVIILFAEREGMDIYTLLLEVSIHFEDGAVKYGDNNWKKGIPLHCYIDSGVRHLLKHLRGDTDEPHDRAFVWNILCAIWTQTHKPELDDVEMDILPREVKQESKLQD